MIADGEKIFRDMDPEILQTLLDREVRGQFCSARASTLLSLLRTCCAPAA